MNKLMVKNTILPTISLIGYLLLLRGGVEAIIKIINKDFVLWNTYITNGDIMTLLASIIGFLIILHKMRNSKQSQSVEEENRKHQFYRMVIILVVLVGTIAYNRPMFKVGLISIKLTYLIIFALVLLIGVKLIQRGGEK
ncbi:hypothetical protein [Peptostreptococcus porci]|uniref:hypothetical protein n=1 Tax=Peptostreptococcus porci TaxID=2652282 RepID=UPI002A90DA16|nr:hypothetical protein [Peptostreptococcus porci]MDY6232542.1 hypothetical protein [Peptostreptococcus porci]